MVFSSLIFLLLFLPLSLLAYYFTKNKNIILLISSLLFYAFGGIKYVLVLVGMTLISYIGGRMIDKAKDGYKRRFIMIGTVICQLLILIVFKYTNFILSIINDVAGGHIRAVNIVLPIGISFYTFQLITYVVDVYRKDCRVQVSFWKLLLYSSLFHQCIAGPIVRYQDIAEQIEYREVSPEIVSTGINRFCIGLMKKAVLANYLASLADSIMPTDLAMLKTSSITGLWLGLLLYMLQIYMDFSAYSDMAIGLGKMVGFTYRENFNYPYMAKSVSEFWRRWHMSLGSFFRDYVYIPLGGNRLGKGRTIFNLFVVWSLTGLWHGASVNFLLWGIYFCVFIVIEKLVATKRVSKWGKGISHIYLLVVVYFGWLLFRYSDMTLLASVLKGMFGADHIPFTDLRTTILFKNNFLFIIIALIGSTNLMTCLHDILYDLGEKYRFVMNILLVVEACAVPIMMIISIMSLVGNSYNPFIYYQF